MKLFWGVDEVVTTLLLNFFVLLGVGALLDGPMKDPMALGWPQSVALPSELELTRLIAQTRVHTGLLIGVCAALALWLLLRFTTWGFDIRALGANARAAAFAGVATTRTMVLAAVLSGGLAGLGGAVEVAGRAGYVTLDMSPGYGYTGIVIAMLAGLHPLLVVGASMLVAGVLVGADSMSRQCRRSHLLGRRRRRLGAAGGAHGRHAGPLSAALRSRAAGGMRHPVSTPSCFEEQLSGAVLSGVVGFAIVPGAPDDAQPSASEDANGVRVVAAPGLGLGVDVSGPGIGMARVVGQAGKRCAQTVIAGPAEDDRLGLARCVGDGSDAGLGGEVLVAHEALAHAAELGQELSGADASGAREAHDDLAVLERSDVVLDTAGQESNLLDQALQRASKRSSKLALGLHLEFGTDRGGSLMQPSEQVLGALPAAVGMLGAEGGHALGAERLGGLGRGVALDEGQRDRRVDVGEDGASAWPERLQQATQLVGQLHPSGQQIVASTHQRAQGEDLVALRAQGLEAMTVGAQQVGQHVGVRGVALAAVAT